MFAHEYFRAYVTEILGRRTELLGPLTDSLILPMTISLADQLSVYTDVRNGARFRVGEVRVREGRDRAYLFAPLMDGRRPLRLQAVFAGYRPHTDTSRVDDFAAMHIGRRWRFVETNRHFLERLFSRIGEAIVNYYQRRPYAELTADRAMVRLLEGVDHTTLAIELDDRGEAPGSKDSRDRYRVQ